MNHPACKLPLAEALQKLQGAQSQTATDKLDKGCYAYLAFAVQTARSLDPVWSLGRRMCHGRARPKPVGLAETGHESRWPVLTRHDFLSGTVAAKLRT